MRRILKSSLSFLLSILLILSVVPFVSADAVPVDLLHDTDGDLKQGVYVTASKAAFGTQSIYSLSNAFNNVEGGNSEGWLAKRGAGYMQINFPVAQRITEIKIKPTKRSGYDMHKPFSVRVSNDITFASYETLKEFTNADWTDSTDFSAKTITVTDTTKYQYVQLYWGDWCGLGEIDITGYAETLPSVSASENLAAGDIVFASGDASATSVAQKAIDADTATFIYEETAVENKYIQIDLKKAAQIERVDFLPTTEDAARQYVDVLLSNSPTFETSERIYHRELDAIPSGEEAYAYSHTSTPYRYIRIQKSDNSTGALGLKEVKVWGAYTDDTVIEELAHSATPTAEANATYATDKDYNTVFTGTEIKYEFSAPKYVTSLAFIGAGSEAERSEFKVYGSVVGDFSDEAEILSVITPISDTKFEEIALSADAIQQYRAIKIKSDASTVSLAEVKIFYDVRETRFKVNETIPADGASSGITNIEGAYNFIEVEFNRPVQAETVTPANITIKNTDTGEVLTGWTPYSVSGNTIKIDISILSSNTNYTVTLTTGVKSGQISLGEETSFSFKTATIFAVPYTPGKMIANVAYKKAITGNTNSGSQPLANMVDGQEPAGASHHVTSSNPKIQIDLGNFYDVIGIYLSEYTNYSLLNNIQIKGSDTYTTADLMDKALVTTAAENVPHTLTLSTEKQNVRYVGLYRGSSFVQIKEFSVYALVDVDFGKWSSPETITNTGNYTFSVLARNYTGVEKNYYILLASYDVTGAMTNVVVEPVILGAETGTDVTLQASITVDSSVEKITAILVDNLTDLEMLVDAKTIQKPVSQ